MIMDKPTRSNREKLSEFYKAFFLESEHGYWTALLDKPLLVSLTIKQQAEHLFTHAYLDECNEAFCRMYGYKSPHEMRGFRFPQLLNLSDPHNIENLMQFLQGGFRVKDVESSEMGKDGQTKYFLNNAMGIVEKGYLTRIWGWQVDITEKKVKHLNSLDSFQALTLKQRSILKQTVQGRSLKEIGMSLKISPKTVATIRQRLMRKLGTANLASLILRAIEIGIEADP